MTGAAGFLGSHQTEVLLDRGHQVVGDDSLLTGSTDNLAGRAGQPAGSAPCWKLPDPSAPCPGPARKSSSPLARRTTPSAGILKNSFSRGVCSH
ncbi:MAG TPA: NAD-dependent epimerase/dehydratase family protein [Actinomycetota bacterium]|nr:NAD-dependent epimerase/dehydratase family protein [Actinomycetota bacterium]